MLLLHRAFRIQNGYYLSVSYVLTIHFHLHNVLNSFLRIYFYVFYGPHISHQWAPSANHRGSIQSYLKKLRCFSPLFIQVPLNVLYQSPHVTSWATESRIVTYCIPFLDYPSLVAYTHFPTSASGYFPFFMFFRNSNLGCLIFPWSYFDLAGISFNSMYYFHQRIDRLTHCNFVVIVIFDV